MSEENLSLAEVEDFYEREWIDLHADLYLKVNFSILPDEGENGERLKTNSVLINVVVNDKYTAFGALTANDGSEWTLETITEIFQIGRDLKIWQAENHITRKEFEEPLEQSRTESDDDE